MNSEYGIHSYTSKMVNHESLKRKIAAILIYSMLGSQTLTSLAGTGEFTKDNAAATASNASSGTGKSGSETNRYNGEGPLLLSGTITTLGTDINPKNRAYGVYVNGVLDRSLEVTYVAGTATDSNAWAIPIINDLEGDDDLDEEVNIWTYYVYTDVDEEEEASSGNIYSVRDMTDLKATASNAYKDGDANDNSKWALFYLDDEGDVISSEGNWSTDAQNLVYIGKEDIKGSFENRSEIASLPETISLIVTALEEDDEEYLATASGWIATGAGTWTISDALMYNPETLERIVWRGQADYDTNGTAVMKYENVGDFEGDTDYVYSDGIIIFEDILCTVTGSIYWNDWNDKYEKRIELTNSDITVTDADGNDISDRVKIESDPEDPSVLYYTVEGLSTGAEYNISITVPDGYRTDKEAITFRAEGEAELEQIVLTVSDPVSITIDNKIYGLSDDAETVCTYKVYVDGDEYEGIYYIVDEEGNEIRSGSGPITLSANESIRIEMGISSDAVVTIEQTSVSAGIKQIGTNDGDNVFYFTYAAETSVLASIVWNDNKDAEGFRPDGGNDKSNWAAYLQLTFTLGDDDTSYSIEEYYSLLGLESWDGFSYLDSFGEAPDYYFSADGLPTHIINGAGEVVEVHYSVGASDAANYEKDDQGYVDTEYGSDSTRLSSWKFVYTALTTFEAKVVWYDDNDENNTRPTEEEWLKALWLVRENEVGTVVTGQITQVEQVDGEAGVYSITITFDDGTEVSSTVTIDKAEDGKTWSFEIDGLIAYDEDGIPFIYYVAQDIPEVSDGSTLLNGISDVAYDTNYGNEGINLGNTEKTYEGGTIINTLTGHFDFTATKEWLDGDTSPADRPTVTLALWRYTKGSDEGYLEAAKVYVVADLIYDDETGQYTVSVENLPAFDEDGHEYVYFMIESMTAVGGGVAVSEYKLTVENVSPFTAEEGISQNSSEPLIYNGSTFTNQLSNTINVEAKKIWQAKAIQGALDQYTVTLKLQRTINGEDWDDLEEITLDSFAPEFTSLSHTFKNQDKYDENGNEYTYRVIETGVTGNGTVADLSDPDKIQAALDGGAEYTLGKYIFIYSIDEDGNIINELVADLDLIVEKEWSPSAPDGLDELTFLLYQNGELYNNEELGIINGEIKLEKDNNGEWSVSFEGLPRYDEEGREYNYSIEEVKVDGYISIIRIDLIYDSEEQKYILTSTVTNYTDQDQATYAKVHKQWLDDYDTTLRGEVQVQLTDENGNEVSPASGETTSVNLNEGNCWYDYFLLDDNVDFADYRIKEVSVDGSFNTLSQEGVENNNLIYNSECEYISIDGMIYEISYNYKAPESGEAFGTFTVTNRRIGKITINLEKEWQENIDVSRYSVVFYLYQNGELIGEVTLSDDNYWKYSFGKLDKFDENGALYEYTLVEYSITDEETGYVYGKENSVTVGNETTLKNSDDQEDTFSVIITSTYEAEVGEYNFVAENSRTGLKDITFNKIWKDSNETDGVTRPDIYLKLYRYIDINGNGIIDDSEWDTVCRLDITPTWVKIDDTHWAITYPSMPKYSSSGESYIYLAQEGMAATSSGGWNQIYLDVFSDGVIFAADDTQKGYMPSDGAVVNYREGTTYINGTKIWENMGKYIGEDDYPIIKIYLFYRLQDGNGDYGEWQYSERSSDAVWDSALGKYTYSFDELPKYDPETGYTIQYSISEIVDDEGNENMGGFEWIEYSTNFKLINTYSEDTDVSITVKKNWEGYPEDLTSIGYPTINLVLYRVIQKWNPDSKEYEDISAKIKVGEAALSNHDGNDWEYTWSDLSYYAPNGRPYRYYVEELNINGYTTATATASNAIEITNTYTQETVEIAGRKVWIDFCDKWGMRPENITLKLYRYTPSMGKENAEDLEADFIWTKEPVDYDGRYVWTYEAQANTKAFYRYATTGERYTYFIEETMVPGYQTPIYIDDNKNFDEESGIWTLTVTNRLVTVELEVNKQWEDGNDQYDTRPETVTVQLQRKWGTGEYEAVINPDDPGASAWEVSVESSYTFTDLPKYHVDEDGNRFLYEYRAQEINVDGGYEVSYNYESNTATITNTLKTVKIAVEKVWDDAENQDGIRSSVTMILYRNDGKEMGRQTLSDVDGWSYTWSGLPKYDSDGDEYAYYVEEEDASPYETAYEVYYLDNDYKLIEKEYTDPISPKQNTTGFVTVTNTYVPKTMEISISKDWQGDSGNILLRPYSITYTLMQKLEGEDDTAWETVSLAGEEGNVSQTVNNDGDGNFETITWTDLPVKRNGVTILYKVVETSVTGYTASYSYDYVNGTLESESNKDGNSQSITVTNTLTAKTDAAIVKVWNDHFAGYDRTDEIASITFKLQRKLLTAADEEYADVTKADVGYTDGAAADASTPVTITLTVTEQDLEYVFENLPRYNDQGDEFAYRAVEAYFTLTAEFGSSQVGVNSTDDLSGSIGGYEYETEYLPAEESDLEDYTKGSTATVSNALKTRSVKVEKIWEDAGEWLGGAYIWWDQDGLRPNTVTLELLYDGKSFDPVKTVTLGKNDDDSWSWSHEWKELPYYHADGTEFEYTVAEFAGAAEGYREPEYTVSDDGTLTVTNPCDPETTSVTVYKLWSGDEDWEEDRPDSIFVQLYMTIDGEDIAYGDPAEVTAEARWTYTWEDLPVHYNTAATKTRPGSSEEIYYFVKEASEHGYTADIEGNTITNTLSTTQLQVTKVWEDQNDYYQTRPDSITIQLQRSVDKENWADVGDAQELSVTSDKTLQFIYTGLPIKDKNSSNYYYRAVEVKIGDKTVTNDSASGYQVAYGGEYTEGSIPGEMEIINTLITTDLDGTKTWVDQSNYYDTRPDKIDLTLKSDPEEALAGKQPEENYLSWIKDGDMWSYSYSGLPKYAADGAAITYWVEEEGVPANYEVTYDENGKNITNTMPTIELSGTKTWEDQSNRYEIRPDNIELTVLANGTRMSIQPQIIWDSSSGNVWVYRITGLPGTDRDGAEILYTVEETDVSGYDRLQEGFALTNTLRTGGIVVEKIQKGSNSAVDFTFHVTLIINGREIPYAGTYTMLKSEDDLTAEGESMETSDGTIVMKGSYKFYITDLPAGVSYVITEDSHSRFTLTGTVNDQGTIPYQTVQEASFTNQYKSSGGGSGGNSSSTQSKTSAVTDSSSSGDLTTIQDGDTPLAQVTFPIGEEGIPLMGLARTGDSSLPLPMLISIMLGALGGMIVLILKRRKEREEE